MSIIPIQLARVSNLLKSSVATGSIATTQASLLEVQNELSTGKQINSPSDDPGNAAIAQQLHKVLEQRDSYSTNLKNAQSQLGEVDSSLSDLNDLLQQAQTIASANVGSDVTADGRKAAAAVVQSLYNQALTIGNRDLNGVHLFAGDRQPDPPFVSVQGGVKFVGDDNILHNNTDDATQSAFMVDGNRVFGATSTRVQGSVNLDPTLAPNTRLTDLGGAGNDGIHLGGILIGNGTVSTSVDLSQADTIQDVIDQINKAAVGGITASFSADGKGIQLNGTGADQISVREVGGGSTASDLGLLTTTTNAAAVPVNGADLRPQLTLLTPVASLRGGTGIDLTSGITITNGGVTANIDLSGANTVEDILNKINGSKAGVVAKINAAGNGIDVVNPIQGPSLTIAENGGTTASDLGIRSFASDTPLSQLNGGKGVRTAASGADLQITRRDGTAFSVELTAAQTVQDVIVAINTADGGNGLTASFAATGNGIVLTDTTGGGGVLSAKDLNNSNSTADLGLNASVTGSTINGSDVNAVEANGIFANIGKLRDALQSNNIDAITASGVSIKQDQDRVIQIRGETGAQVQELEARASHLDDQNVATKSLLSSLEDTDFTTAITKFQTLQQALQANYLTASKVMNQSLMDFLT